MGTLAIAVFATLFLRLWSLQILNGDHQLRDVRIQAPRGAILDRNGQRFVTNIPGLRVQVQITDLPKRRSVRLREIRALARVLGVPALQLGALIRRHRSDPLTPVKVKENVPEQLAFYIMERPEDFPGVQVVPSYLRYYPHRELGAHVLGYVSEISPAQL